MCDKKNVHQFLQVVIFGAIGIFFGILLGFVFGALIHYLHSFVATQADQIIPLSISTFLGMGVGAVVGGVVGGVAVLKK